MSGASATIFAYLGEFHCNKLRNRAIMSAAFVAAICALAHPIMGWAVINRYWSFYVPLVDIVYKPWRMYILCCGLLGFVSGLCFIVLPESPKYLISIGKETEAIAVLKMVYSINTGNKAESLEVRILYNFIKILFSFFILKCLGLFNCPRCWGRTKIKIDKRWRFVYRVSISIDVESDSTFIQTRAFAQDSFVLSYTILDIFQCTRTLYVVSIFAKYSYAIYKRLSRWKKPNV